MYGLIAAYEDDFLSPEDYKLYARSLAQKVPRGASGVDIGCGSGRLTEALYDEGLCVSGVDPSPEMLQNAMQRAAASGRRIRYVEGDAGVKGFRKLGFITAATDVVNHIKAPQAFFTRAYEALLPGGVLMLDISSAYKLISMVADRTFYKETEHFARIWNTFYRPERHIIEMEVIYFVRSSGGYDRRSASGMQYIHPTETILDALTAAGFTAKAASSLNGDAVATDSERIYVTAYKE